ncbi:multisubunit Na+/H+ antiporter MnhF subunit [Pseudorhizobium tarimense]|uniref:Multisubunit Na+/H+ antiporter MnhF subunit n=1 Tax=Pseudorhizobium tarimense TaxID=1079109 RepID=A0ABV2H0F9_9HYPH
MTAQSITQFSVNVGLVVVSITFLLTVWRVIKGPTLPDRVIALDMLVGIVMGFIALIAIRTGFTLYIDIAISLGLVGFLATVAFARFILSRKRRGGEDGSPPEPEPKRPAAKEPRKAATPAAVPVAAGPAGAVALAEAGQANLAAAPKEAAPRAPISKSEATKASAAKVKIAKAKAAKKAASPAEPAAAKQVPKTAAKTLSKPPKPMVPRKPAAKKESP